MPEDLSTNKSALSRLRRALDRSPFEPYSGGTTPAPPTVVKRGSEGFSGTQAAKVVGISYRQLDYWARTELVRPSLSDAEGSGSRRRYSYEDLLELRAIKALLDAGLKLDSVREVFRYLHEHVDGDISSAHLVMNGNSIVLARGDELADVLQAADGVVNVLPLGSIKDEVDAQLVPLINDQDDAAAAAW